MKKSSVEWGKIQELMECIEELTPYQQEVVDNWFRNLDPNEPFLNQQSEKQWKWLNFLHAKVVEGNEEKARGYYD